MQARSARTATTVAVLLAGLLWFPAATSAAGLTISPVVVQIDSPRKPVAITISNQSDRPITLQADTKVWLQVDGIDQYAPTDELLVVPAIAQVPPNGSQVFRIALRRPSGAPVERTYRLILEDISEEQRPSQTSAVAFKLTHNLPVMVAPSAPLVTAVRWTPCASKPSQACVRVVNTGNYRLKVQGLTLAGDGWRHALPLKAPEIILAGAAREWQVALAPAEAGAVRGVQVHSAQGATLEAEVGKSS
jgi:fimbrial chaperone protein